MASFEPFVSSDPFNMETFNTKLGGAFGKVDAATESAKLTFTTIYFDATIGSHDSTTKTVQVSRELFNKFKMITCRCWGDSSNRKAYSALMAKANDLKWEANLVTTVPVQNTIAGRYVTIESTSETEITITIGNGYLGTNNNANNVAIVVEIVAIY